MTENRFLRKENDHQCHVKFPTKNFEFNNADMSRGSTLQKKSTSTMVSAYEQLSFAVKFWQGELKTPGAALAKIKKLLISDISPKGLELKGQGESDFVGTNRDLRLEWYVGHLDAKGQEYILVVNFVDKIVKTEKSFGGIEAKEIGKKELKKLKLW